ncbi:class I SAM-dependent methyltransferase [Poseidonocella sp. HB161398]|uniref:class I SAM-dependent methyltransferase n=1 Tax=Poseidonocella sp. HB161398 TaxID=2320855 RepID=UPI00110902CA|nr:class I SAM-dependent methyltransferase [Poseidonocella sp. HB161398]
MDRQAIDDLYHAHHRDGWGSVAEDELEFFQSVIAADRPGNFIEVGTASGLSGGFLARFLAENGGRRLVTLDFEEQFFGDRSRQVGFQIDPVKGDAAIEVARYRGITLLDLPEDVTGFDMGFVDANHQHPWPLLDTLLLHPRMPRGGKLFHHDLKLYRDDGHFNSIGPKHCYDQFPDSHRHVSAARGGNSYWLDLSMSREELGARGAAGLLIPWTLMEPLPEAQIEAAAAQLGRHYGPALRDTFLTAAARFNWIRISRPKRIIGKLKRRFAAAG